MADARGAGRRARPLAGAAGGGAGQGTAFAIAVRAEGLDVADAPLPVALGRAARLAGLPGAARGARPPAGDRHHAGSGGAAPHAARPDGARRASSRRSRPVAQAVAEEAEGLTIDDLGSSRAGPRRRLHATRVAGAPHLPFLRSAHARRPAATRPDPRQEPARPPQGRHRRPGRRGQDHAHRRARPRAQGRAVARGHHQRHLHAGGRRGADADADPAAGPHPRRRDRRLPAHRDPRGRQHQPRRRARAAGAAPATST